MNITAALHRAVHGFAAGPAGLAALMNMSVNSLLHKVNPTDRTAHCSPEQLVQVCAFTGDYTPLHALCANLSHQAMPLLPLGDVPCAQELASAMKEAADVFVRASALLQQGRPPTANELAGLQREVLESNTAMAQLMAHLLAQHDAAKPKL